MDKSLNLGKCLNSHITKAILYQQHVWRRYWYI